MPALKCASDPLQALVSEVVCVLAALPLQALPLPSQCLFLRLFQRKGPLFSLASLSSYKEVPDPAAAGAQLAAAGLATMASADTLAAAAAEAESSVAAAAEIIAPEAADWRQLAGLLTVPELAAVLAARRINAAGPAGGASGAQGGRSKGGGALRNREQLLAALEAHAATSAAAESALAGWLLGASGRVLRLAAPACEAVSRLQRLFFLNEGHGLSQVGFGKRPAGLFALPVSTCPLVCCSMESRLASSPPCCLNNASPLVLRSSWPATWEHCSTRSTRCTAPSRPSAPAPSCWSTRAP